MRLTSSVFCLMMNLEVSQKTCLDPSGLVLDRLRFTTVMDHILKTSTDGVNPVFSVADNQYVISNNEYTLNTRDEQYSFFGQYPEVYQMFCNVYMLVILSFCIVNCDRVILILDNRNTRGQVFLRGFDEGGRVQDFYEKSYIFAGASLFTVNIGKIC